MRVREASMSLYVVSIHSASSAACFLWNFVVRGESGSSRSSSSSRFARWGLPGGATSAPSASSSPLRKWAARARRLSRASCSRPSIIVSLTHPSIFSKRLSVSSTRHSAPIIAPAPMPDFLFFFFLGRSGTSTLTVFRLSGVERIGLLPSPPPASSLACCTARQVSYRSRPSVRVVCSSSTSALSVCSASSCVSRTMLDTLRFGIALPSAPGGCERRWRVVASR
mmetsp:Transcript_69616/g.194584  ORF Transcript_69616/g.194584 Transcript_69616/m.194584 type:complete len:224 (-) Transcript_69616:842-1513(-)